MHMWMTAQNRLDYYWSAIVQIRGSILIVQIRGSILVKLDLVQLRRSILVKLDTAFTPFHSIYSSRSHAETLRWRPGDGDWEFLLGFHIH